MSWTQSRFLGGLDMSMFSLQCCYAALTAYATEGDGLLDAILQMVIVVVDERKYKRLDVQEIVKDFEKRFHFTVPYHPMQMVIGLGIDKGYDYFLLGTL